MDADVLNAALEMRLDGDVAVNERLQALYPPLSEEEADDHRRECGSAMSYSEEIAQEDWLRELAADQQSDVLLRERFTWLNPRNVNRLLCRGMYCAARNIGVIIPARTV